jgi:hypothetical protein
MFNNPQDDKNQQPSQESSPFFSVDQPVFSQEEAVEQKASGKILGLSPMQRAVIMILIFVLTCVGGSLCLLLSGKIVF